MIGGAHVGFNLNYDQRLVFGAEGSVDGTSLSHTIAVPVNDFFFDTPGVITTITQAGVQGSIRCRIGIAFDRALIYGTGGVAFTGYKTTLFDETGFFTGLPGTTATISNTWVGWTAALNMLSPTIGRSGPRTAIRISATLPNPHSPASCHSLTASFSCSIV